MTVQVLHGDCLEVLRGLEDCSVDAVITDPPYGLSNTKPTQVADVLKAWVTGDTATVPAGKGFMGKDWDSFVPPPAVWEECMRVLKPGGHMAVFAGARTQDLMGLSIRLAGFEIRDTLGWIYGSGFPKSMDVSKAIDKAVGAEGTYGAPKSAAHAAHIGKGDYSTDEKNPGWDRPWMHDADSIDRSARIYEGGSEDARLWSGWGTALKPAIEPIILARKPLVGTVAANVLAHGVGGLNIDACRVGMSDADREAAKVPQSAMRSGGEDNGHALGTGTGRLGVKFEPAPAGRFPANVLLDEHAAQEMDKQSGVLRARGNTTPTAGGGGMYGHKVVAVDHGGGDSGGASRFFPVFKSEEETPETKGRFPANVLLDEHAAKEMDKQSGWSPSNARKRKKAEGKEGDPSEFLGTLKGTGAGYEVSDSGGASRFFPVFKYQAKAPKRERPVAEREDGTKIQHPTVKPVALMEWLVELITPPGGVVLDPFAGSGTTLQAALNKGFSPIGIEQDADYIKLIEKRLEVGPSTHNS